MKIKVTIILLVLFTGAFADNSKHFKAAKEHVKINFTINSPHAMAESVTNGLLMQQPQNKPFKEVYISFFEKIYTSDELYNAITKIYVKNYSLEELEYANKVFSDPKLISYMKKTPIIMQESMIMGRKIAEKHLDELKSALDTRAKELERK